MKHHAHKSLAEACGDLGLPPARWLGHAGFEVGVAGLRILIDPVLAPRLLVVPRRLPVPDLTPGADLVLLSHTHRDHFDIPTLEQADPHRIVLPEGSERFLPPHLRDRAIPVIPGGTFVDGPVAIRAFAAIHPGWRSPLGRSHPALSYLIETGDRRIYHAGDTALGPHFADLGAASPPDLAFIPIGAYSPRIVLRDKHLSPEEAVAAALALRARWTIPCHFGTYRLSFEPLHEPLPRFIRAAAAHGLAWAHPGST